jgi:hypothetical protein
MSCYVSLFAIQRVDKKILCLATLVCQKCDEVPEIVRTGTNDNSKPAAAERTFIDPPPVYYIRMMGFETRRKRCSIGYRTGQNSSFFYFLQILAIVNKRKYIFNW